MEKKRPLGFKTPSMRIEEEYKEILEQVMSKKANWEKLLSLSYAGATIAQMNVKDFSKVVEQKRQKTREDLMELEQRAIAMAISVTQVLAARIGKELADV